MAKSNYGTEFKIPGQQIYDGMIMSTNINPESAHKVQAMELEPTDVVIASYPKTGTTLIQEVVWLIRNNGDTDLANKTVNVARIPFMEFAFDSAKAKLEALPHPRHLKTHLPYRYMPKSCREAQAKVVYIVRNPKDCLVSYYHFHRMNRGLGNFSGSWDEFFDYFRASGYILGYGNLLDHMRGFWEHKDDANMCIVSFEDLITDRHGVIEHLAKFLECNLTKETVDKIAKATGFDAMRSNPITNMDFGERVQLKHDISPFMRKGQIGDWKNYFNEEQNQILDEMVKDRLAGTDLKFVYE